MQELITIEDISRIFGYSVRHTRDRLIKRPDFPTALKVGRTRRWYRHEFEKWLAKQREH